MLTKKIVNISGKVFDRTGQSLKVVKNGTGGYDRDIGLYSGYGDHQGSWYEAEVHKLRCLIKE